ncbi:KIF28-like protein [Mya arenaria]|uniref:KIF28-like protein n=1 Tax=Mya arenaria TaxID=6604 RepID=A0ABY7D7G3_MYAAR|nr:KIF28-like protein [Mya arenaria]
MAENVRVAVRIARNATLIIEMNGHTTEIKDPENQKNEPKRFTFDFSYWSHDEFTEQSDGYNEPNGSKYADQVTFTMLEIYNEQVRDLLNAKSMTMKGGLKNLTTAAVNSFKEIDNKINEGNRNKTVAATSMNATSSRAHTIVALTLTQKSPNETGETDSTGATGDRLKEGSAINQSLSSLGNVIKALADQSTGKKKVVVPYRDSVLTRLLQNALGGNSKTIMIAALSPADINYEETLSTLRFADRAKAIKTTATVNESPTDKLIRELREENARLMEMLKTGGVVMAPSGGGGGGSSEEVEEMKRQMEEELRKKEEELENLSKTYEQRMADAATSNKGGVSAADKEEGDKKVIPHFWNLNEDPALTGMIVHFANEGTSRVGNKNASKKPDIMLNGLSIGKDHAEIINKKGNVSIKPGPSAKDIMVNGTKIVGETKLSHNDRISFGPNHLYVFHHPQDYAKKTNAGEKVETPTFDSAQEEIAKESGLMTTPTDGMSKEKSKDEALLQEDLVQILPMVAEANAMAEELGKGVKFEINLVSPQARGIKDGRTEVMVKMLAQDGSGNDWLWDRNKFINRKYIMQEMYANFAEGDDDWDLPQERDPFWEPADTEKLIGTCHVLLQSLAFNIDLEEKLVISDFKGHDQGHVDVAIVPCTSDFKPVSEDDFVEDPKELSFCRYKFYLDKDYVQTDEISGTINPQFNHEKRVTIKSGGKAPKKSAAAAGGTAVQNGGMGAAPLPPIADNKSKEEAARYRQDAEKSKKRAEESEAKLSKINSYLRERKTKGHSAMRRGFVK